MLSAINSEINAMVKKNFENEFYARKFANWLLFTKFKNRKTVYELVHAMLKDGWSLKNIMNGYVHDETGEYFVMSNDAYVLSFIYGRTETPAFTVALTVPAKFAL